jgi:endoglucanase
VILDLHNYGRYRLTTSGKVVECVIDEPIDGRVLVSRNDFADFWRKFALEFRDQPAVHSFGLMNEPHHMGGSDWKAISQAAVVAIRATGSKNLLLVAGDDWSSAERWGQANGSKPWINDPVRRIAYEAHCYFDHDSSGKYRLSYDEELAKDPDLRERGRRRVTPFIEWCAKNRVQGVVGEFATPRDAKWKQVLAPFLSTLRDSNMDSVWWAAGDWWRNYPMSLQPSANQHTAAPQLSWILDAQNPVRTVTSRR